MSEYQSKSSLWPLIWIGLIMFIGIMVLAKLGTPPAISAKGEPFPVVDLQPLNEQASPVDAESLQGKVSVLHFWGTWCPPCLLEYPEYAELAKEFESNEQVQFLSISCSQEAEYDLKALNERTQAFLSERGLSMPIYSDSAAATRGALSYLLPNGEFQYPTTVVVDQKGKIADVQMGYFPPSAKRLQGMQRIRSVIEKLLESSPESSISASGPAI